MQPKADMVTQRMWIQPIRNSFLHMRTHFVTFSMLTCNGKEVVNLYKSSIFVITQTQFATQTQLM